MIPTIEKKKKKKRERERVIGMTSGGKIIGIIFTSGLIRLCLISCFIHPLFPCSCHITFSSIFVPDFSKVIYSRLDLWKLRKEKKKTLEIICAPVSCSNLADYYWIFIQTRIPDI